jgi:hypothetical protein
VQGVTIDLENARTLNMLDIISDADRLYDLLLEDVVFEKITAWDEEKGNYTFGDDFYERRDIFTDAAKSNEPYEINPYLNWYLDGGNFVILTGGRYHRQYSAKIIDVIEIFTSDFIDMIGIN